MISTSAGDGAPWRRVLLLAGALSLDTADRSTLSAVERQLEGELGIGPAAFGVLAAATPVVGLLGVLPVGVLVDRVPRTRLLAACAGVWVLGQAVVVLAPTFGVLLVGRGALGLVLAALPAMTSLAGDFFPAERRARYYGYVLSGELVGTAVGFLGTGAIGAAVSWRWGFVVLAAAGVAVAVGAWRVDEPQRGAQRADARPGANGPDGVGTAGTGAGGVSAGDGTGAGGTGAGGTLRDRLREAGVAPSPGAVLERSPADLPARAVLAYVLRVRSNVVLITVSALTYLYLSGVQTFAVRFGADQLGLVGTGTTLMLVGLGASAIVGVLVVGRIADHLIGRGRVNARVLVTATTLFVALACFLPGTLITDVALAAPLLLIGAAALGGSNPPLDAARLDVLHHDAWGRAEAVRSTLRLSGYAIAPLMLGALIEVAGTGPAFAILTAALAVAGGVMLLALRSYPGDVAAAVATPVGAAGRTSA